MLVLRYLFWLMARVILPLRYRVHVHGGEKIANLKGPTLILPNHPAETDPMLVLLTVWPALKPRPMLAEEMFENPLFAPIMKLVKAVRLPDLKKMSSRARLRAEKAIQEVVEGLRQGENYLMWPAGRIERHGKEILGGARALTDILRDVPEANIVVLRTVGLWGSRFSFAWTGEVPRFFKQMLAGIGWTLAGLFFFMPRRPVTMTFEVVDRQQLPELERGKINAWFENWYNAEGVGDPVYVPYSFLFGPKTRDYPKLEDGTVIDLAKVTEETKTVVSRILSEKLGRSLSQQEMQPEIPLDSLGMDSLDRMEVNLEVERHFGIFADQVPQTLGQLWGLAQGLLEQKPPAPPPEKWFQVSKEMGPLTIPGENILDSFFSRALAHPGDVVEADDRAGVLTYERILIGMLLMASRFAKLPGTNIGLLLPASAACDIALLALLMAGKLPVILNWTTGPANLDHAIQLLEVSHVVTSEAFVDRLHLEIDNVEYVFLEDMRSEFGLWERMGTFLRVRWFPKSIRKRVPTISPDQPAVVLFTSGSEKAPKAVPLTHRNLLANQRGSLEAMNFTRQDSLLGFLPAFHSFGLSITGLIPLLAGIRVVRHPDPTNASALVRKIASYKPTLLLATPTFLTHILDRAKPNDLSSLRMIIVGAEKCPQRLFDRCAEMVPHAKIIEGYGITECAPAVSTNRPQSPRPGTVGQPIPSVEVCIVDLETGEPLPPGNQGMLLVSGPSIFPGYIGHDGPQPFRELNGKRWYITGDLVQIDETGTITFAGRLKRFLKAGGEMISLPALEEPFARQYPPTEEGPRIAVEGIETDSRARIVLFTKEPMKLEDANRILRKEGFQGIMRIDEVRQVESIPILGTGKTDYKVLRAQLQKEQEKVEVS